MAFINKQGKLVTYDCDGLIKELKEDIAEFGGDMIVEVVTQEFEGVTLYKDYNFIDDEDKKNAFKLDDNERMQRMTATALLMLYEQESSIC